MNRHACATAVIHSDLLDDGVRKVRATLRLLANGLPKAKALQSQLPWLDERLQDLAGQAYFAFASVPAPALGGGAAVIGLFGAAPVPAPAPGAAKLVKKNGPPSPLKKLKA